MPFDGVWHFRITLYFGFLAFVFNSLLCYIILITRCDYIGHYKWLLFLYTCSAALYGLCQMATTGDFIMVDSGYMFYDVHGILPIWAGEVVLFTLVTVYIVNMVILMLSFIYRYLTVCSHERLEVFHRHWKMAALISLAVIFSQMAALIYTLRPTPVTDNTFKEAFHNVTGLRVTDVAYIAAIYFIGGKLNIEMLVSNLAFLLFGMITGLVMTFLAVKIGKGLKDRRKDSITLAKNKKKIFILLIFQLCLPLFFNLIPLQIIVVSVYFHLRSQSLTQYFGCILSLAQTVDPLLTFYFIRPYRIALLRKLCTRLSIIRPGGTGTPSR